MEGEKQKIQLLMEKGVQIPNPEAVEIGSEVDADNIDKKDVVIHSGCKIFGRDTLILSGTILGSEAPVTIDNCQIGRHVELKGGSFRESVFLDRVNIGSGAQVRRGCLLEEEVTAAHTVGLKQSILFPFVTLGSLINFCDCLMAGGTSRKDHSEVGSSYIHFNFTPHQDKATPSLMGDVPAGVMLNKAPIFLGGQGGLVGPARIAYGAVIAAGTILRGDALRENHLYIEGSAGKSRNVPFYPGLYRNIEPVLKKNILYLGNLAALRQWYLKVRSIFMTGEKERLLWTGALRKLDQAYGERLSRLKDLAEKMPRSIKLYRKVKHEKVPEKTIIQQSEFYKKWGEMENALRNCFELEGDPSKRDPFLYQLEQEIKAFGLNYPVVIQSLPPDWSEAGTQWLQAIVDRTLKIAAGIIPSLNLNKKDL